MKKRSALFFDIDGTLLSEKTKEIPASTVRALQKTKQEGHAVFINTGRTLCSVPVKIKRLAFDGLLCGCGTYIVYQNEILFEHPLPEDHGYEYIDRMRELQIDGFLEGTEDVYFSERISRFENVESTRRYMASMGLGVEVAYEKKGFRYDEILICTDEKSHKEEFFQAIDKDLIPLDRQKGVYECIQKGYSKATAIEVMRRHLELSMDQIYVFGDSSNDLSMFEYAKHTVAMGEHDPVLEPYTEYITDAVEQDGIEKAMEYYRLI